MNNEQTVLPRIRLPCRTAARLVAALQDIIKMPHDVGAIPDGAIRQAPPGHGNPCRTVIIGRQGTVQITVIALLQLLQVACTGIHIGAGIQHLGQLLQSQVSCRAGPEYLHQPVGICL